MSTLETLALLQVAREEQGIAAAKIVGTVETLLKYNAIESIVCARNLTDYVAQYHAAYLRVLEHCTALEKKEHAEVINANE